MSNLYLLEDDEVVIRKKYLNELIADRDDYKQRFEAFCVLTDRLKNAFLGPGYYIADSCGEPQASANIIRDIINKYAPRYTNGGKKSKKPFDIGKFLRR